MALPLSQYSIQLHIFFLGFKCLVILRPNLDILCLFRILFNASLCFIVKYLGSPVLAIPYREQHWTASVQLAAGVSSDHGDGRLHPHPPIPTLQKVIKSIIPSRMGTPGT